MLRILLVTLLGLSLAVGRGPTSRSRRPTRSRNGNAC